MSGDNNGVTISIWCVVQSFGLALVSCLVGHNRGNNVVPALLEDTVINFIVLSSYGGETLMLRLGFQCLAVPQYLPFLFVVFLLQSLVVT